MNRIRTLIMTVALLCSEVVSAAVVSVSATGNYIGAEGSYYYNGEGFTGWAGIVELDIDGSRYWAMPTVPMNPPDTCAYCWWTPSPGPYVDMYFYTRDEILAGGTGTWGEYLYSDGYMSTPDEVYSRVSWLFLNGMLGVDPPDPLWAAGHHEMVWQEYFAIPLTGGEDPDFWDNANLVYDPASGITLHDVYTYTYAPMLDPNFDYSDFMGVLSSEGPGESGVPFELLVFTSPVPVSPAVWLFGSGLMGLIAAARRRPAISET